MFAKKINDIYLQYFQEVCPSCHETYNMTQNIPYVVCYKQHYCCYNCIHGTIFTQGKDDSQCPQCKQPINRKRIAKLRLFKKIQEYHYLMISKCTQYQSESEKIIEDLNRTIQEILQNQGCRQLQQQYHLVPIKKQEEVCKSKMQEKILIEEAQNYFLESKFQKAIAICKKMIEVNEEPSEVYYGFGGKQDFIGYQQQYIKEYYRSYKQERAYRSPYDLLSLALLLSSDLEQDKPWFEKQIKKNPKNYQLRFGLGLLLSNFDNKEEAIEQFQIVSKINPNFDKVDQCIAFEWYSKGDLQKARYYAQACLKKNPLNIYAMFIRAMTNQDEEQVIKDLLELIDHSTEYLVPLHELGLIYFNRNQCEKAIECFQKCLEKSNYYNSSKISLARCFIETKEYAKSIEVLEDLVKRQEDDEEVLMILSMAYLKLLNQEQAHKHIEKCKEKYPHNYKINYILADVYLLEGELDLAIATYKELLETDQQNYQLIKLVALTFLKKADTYNANEWLEEYFNHEPQDLSIRFKFAQGYFQQNKKEQALQLFLQCVQKDHEISEAYPKIIDIYTEKHMYEQALSWAQKWSEVSPEDADSWNAISSVTRMIGMKIKSNQWKPKKKRHI